MSKCGQPRRTKNKYLITTLPGQLDSERSRTATSAENETAEG